MRAKRPKIHTIDSLKALGVRVPSGCLEWPRDPHNEYPRIWHNGRDERVHRLSWVLAKGPIPPGKCVCHRCDNPRCFDDAHLFLGTKAENNHDKKAKGRSARLSGSKNGRAKISAEQAAAIVSDGRTLRAIAEEYSLSITQTGRIKRGERWAA